MDKKSLKRAFLPVFTFARIDTKRLFRDKVAMFFVFFFPLIFLVIFGSIFRGGGDVSFKVALLNQSQSEFAGEFAKQINAIDVFDVDEEVTNMDEAREKMRRGQVSATIILPETFGDKREGGFPEGEAVVLYDQDDEQAGRTLGSIMETIFNDINSELVPRENPFSVRAESTATEGLSQFDYTFSGILGFALLSLGVFGPTSVFPRLKSRGVLRRYQTTSLKVWQYFVGNVLSNAFVGILSVGLMFVVALLLFDLNMRGNIFNLMAIVVLGATMLFGIGLAIGGWAKNENQAAPIAQIVVLPMMFLSGVFFPTFLMPEILQRITAFIPLTPIIDSVRLIVTEDAGLLDLGMRLPIMLVWVVVIYIIAFRVFRWE